MKDKKVESLLRENVEMELARALDNLVLICEHPIVMELAFGAMDAMKKLSEEYPDAKSTYLMMDNCYKLLPVVINSGGNKELLRETFSDAELLSLSNTFGYIKESLYESMEAMGIIKEEEL